MPSVPKMERACEWVQTPRRNGSKASNAPCNGTLLRRMIKASRCNTSSSCNALGAAGARDVPQGRGSGNTVRQPGGKARRGVVDLGLRAVSGGCWGCPKAADSAGAAQAAA
mmetsp:Transcript_37133/g.80718  ORF Transcript_37133/g.80718 Transcript_37133/m.80718 type:complete len:111 (-) Transcript_37133:1717-2049(-)